MTSPGTQAERRRATSEVAFGADLGQLVEARVLNNSDRHADAVVAEGAHLSPNEAADYATKSRGPRRRPNVGWESLTPTEMRVAELVADSLTNPAIADRLFVSPATIKTHLAHAYAKLGVANRTGLAAALVRRQAEEG